LSRIVKVRVKPKTNAFCKLVQASEARTQHTLALDKRRLDRRYILKAFNLIHISEQETHSLATAANFLSRFIKALRDARIRRWGRSRRSHSACVGGTGCFGCSDTTSWVDPCGRAGCRGGRGGLRLSMRMNKNVAEQKTVTQVVCV
jgi:hypothetical protein